MINHDKRKLKNLIDDEKIRQKDEIQLIASENYVSEDVREALGSRLTNRYSEGMPYHKYYGGQAVLNEIETMAIDLAKRLFEADHANVQPHAGAQANMAVYNAWCEPGDTILGLALSDGGHLTHGSPVTQAATVYNFEHYNLDEKGFINMEDLESKVIEFMPKILIVGYSAYTRIPDFEAIANMVKLHSPQTLLMADMAHVAGLIAGGAHPNPLNHGFHVMTTTTHKTLRGPRGGLILSKGVVGNPLKKPEKTLENIPTLIDRSVFPGTQGGPLMHCVAAKAVAFAEALEPDFVDYADQIKLNAKMMETRFRKHGVKMQTDGTDNHCLLLDIKGTYGISGGRAEKLLEYIGIVTNKNSIQNDTGTKADPDGLRLGTPAVTTRGFKEEDCSKLADFIHAALSNPDDGVLMGQLKIKVREFSSGFSIP